MARLVISLLGRYSVQLDGASLRAFDSDKVRALLAYLAVKSAAPQRRDHLLGLLWPEQSETQARHNLNQAVYNLRTLLGDRGAGSMGEGAQAPGIERVGTAVPYILLETQLVQFNPQLRKSCCYYVVTSNERAGSCVEKIPGFHSKLIDKLFFA